LPRETADGLSQLHVLFADLLRQARDQAALIGWLGHYHATHQLPAAVILDKSGAVAEPADSRDSTPRLRDSEDKFVDRKHEAVLTSLTMMHTLTSMEHAVSAHVLALSSTLDEALIEPKVPRAFAWCPAYTTQLKARDWERFIESLWSMRRAIRGMRKALTHLLQVRRDQLYYLQHPNRVSSAGSQQSLVRSGGVIPPPVNTAAPADQSESTHSANVHGHVQGTLSRNTSDGPLVAPQPIWDSSSVEASRALLLSLNGDLSMSPVTREAKQSDTVVLPSGASNVSGLRDTESALDAARVQIASHEPPSAAVVARTIMVPNAAEHVTEPHHTAAPQQMTAGSPDIPTVSAVQPAAAGSSASSHLTFHDLQYRVPTAVALDRMGERVTYVMRMLVLHLHTTTTLPGQVLSREEELMAKQARALFFFAQSVGAMMGRSCLV